MTRPTLIFDLGGVLVHIRYNRFIETLGLDHDMDEAALLNTLAPDGRLYESGKISTQEFFARMKRIFNNKYDEPILHRAWYAILAEEVDGMRQIVENVSRQEPVYLLSNTNELHFEYALKKYPVLGLFKHHFVSYRIGAMKPSAEIYQHVIRSLGKKPEELLFVDDTEKNVLGARDAGMRSELFTNGEELRNILGGFGFDG
jgi:HAD superfamily hydrolase (TIGR01509 family)